MDFSIPPLGTPVPTAPSGTITSNQPTFTWSAVPLAAGYDVWLTDLTSGSSAIIGSSSTTFFTAPAPLTAGHLFRWWVRAKSNNGTLGSWSVAIDFA